MIEVEVACELPQIDPGPLAERVRRVCEYEGVTRASAGLMVVGEERMTEINREHRGLDRPTDVLAFPIDRPEAGRGEAKGPPPELGDVVICPAAAKEPLTTLAIHGTLHLLGYDHEVDDGEMLNRQHELVEALS
ncbi:MAG: rRNA maturation RNase YbeY [Thermoleophilia bacterium]|nr:rRNA maturation RNase YbeY [Thermoleophilia bacterium]